MGAKKGNQNAKGNRGGGRKSKYQELADAEFLAEFFFKKNSREDIKKMMAEGNYSVSDVMLTKALAGDMRAIQSVFNKLFPDNLNVTGGLEFDFTDDDEDEEQT